jgi:hypothetical protein
MAQFWTMPAAPAFALVVKVQVNDWPAPSGPGMEQVTDGPPMPVQGDEEEVIVAMPAGVIVSLMTMGPLAGPRPGLVTPSV